MAVTRHTLGPFNFEGNQRKRIGGGIEVDASIQLSVDPSRDPVLSLSSSIHVTLASVSPYQLDTHPSDFSLEPCHGQAARM